MSESRGSSDQDSPVTVTVIWKDVPDPHHYIDATSYLSLVLDPSTVGPIVEALKVAPKQQFKSKDVLRASGLEDLPIDNVHVARDIAKIRSGQPISPVLLVRGDVQRGIPLVIADGYHRVCAIHDLNEDAEISCRIVAFPLGDANLGAGGAHEGQGSAPSPLHDFGL
jgi:hypothetical protein